MAGVLALEVCSLALHSRYRGRLGFTVFCLQRPREGRVYLLGSRPVMGRRGLSFRVRRGAPREEIIRAAAFMACCLVFGEEAEDERTLASVGASSTLPPPDGTA